MTVAYRMTGSSDPLILQVIAARENLDLHIDPADDVVPPFLSGYHPSAIGLAPTGGGVVFEFVGPGAETQVDDLQRLVSQQKGWKLRVIYHNPAPQDELSAVPVKQVSDRLSEAESLAATGHILPAFILGWSVMEAFARIVLVEASILPTKALSPLQSIQSLAEQGVLVEDDARQLRAMVRLRNAAVHGDFATSIRAEDAQQLLYLLRKIEAELSTEETATSPAPQASAP